MTWRRQAEKQITKIELEKMSSTELSGTTLYMKL